MFKRYKKEFDEIYKEVGKKINEKKELDKNVEQVEKFSFSQIITYLSNRHNVLIDKVKQNEKQIEDLKEKLSLLESKQYKTDIEIPPKE